MPYRNLILLLMLTAPAAFIQLQWPKLQVEQSVTVGDASAAGTYAFTNVGEQSITITQVRTSCGCTTATLDKTTYAPGESGQIVATVRGVGDDLWIDREGC